MIQWPSQSHDLKSRTTAKSLANDPVRLLSAHVTRNIFIRRKKFLAIKSPGNIGGKEASVCVSCDSLVTCARVDFCL